MSTIVSAAARHPCFPQQTQQHFQCRLCGEKLHVFATLARKEKRPRDCCRRRGCRDANRSCRNFSLRPWPRNAGCRDSKFRSKQPSRARHHLPRASLGNDAEFFDRRRRHAEHGSFYLRRIRHNPAAKKRARARDIRNRARHQPARARFRAGERNGWAQFAGEPDNFCGNGKHCHNDNA